MKQEARQYAVLTPVCLAVAVLWVPVCQAELKPISDAEMSRVQGQALMSVEKLVGVPHEFTRVTFNMDSELKVSADSVTLGGDAAGADIAIDNLALGHVSTDASRTQIDGKTYAVGEVVPFWGADPYLELAEVDGELAGFRFGFGQARGTVSADMNSFSGTIGLTILDANGTPQDATLFDGLTQATANRATHIGLADPATDCASGTQCSPLTALQSLAVGTDNGDGTVGFTDDFFLSFQREGVEWQDLDGSRLINVGRGISVNLPTSMTIDLQTLQTGIPREQTSYIEQGTNIF